MTTKREQQIQARKARAEELRATIANQVEELGNSEKWEAFLAFSSRFHNYSLNNVLLTKSERAWASRVAGFRKWQELGRQVRKGEKAIKIFGFATKKVQEEDEEKGTEEIRRTYFPVLNVFDISQTDPIPGAETVPEVAVKLEGDDAQGLYAATKTYLEIQGWTVSRQHLEAPNGYATIDGTKQVVVATSLSDAQAAKTILHEAAHAILHANQETPAAERTRPLEEVEAESVAYIVAGAFGLDTSTYTIGYIAGWSQLDQEIIRQTANNVLRAAHQLIDAISELTTPTEQAA